MITKVRGYGVALSGNYENIAQRDVIHALDNNAHAVPFGLKLILMLVAVSSLALLISWAAGWLG